MTQKNRVKISKVPSIVVSQGKLECFIKSHVSPICTDMKRLLKACYRMICTELAFVLLIKVRLIYLHHMLKYAYIFFAWIHVRNWSQRSLLGGVGVKTEVNLLFTNHICLLKMEKKNVSIFNSFWHFAILPFFNYAKHGTHF